MSKAVSAICPFPEVRCKVGRLESCKQVSIKTLPDVVGVASLSNGKGGAAKAEINELGCMEHLLRNILSNHVSDGTGQESIIRAREPDQPRAADWMVHRLPIALVTIFVSVRRAQDIEWLQGIRILIRIVLKRTRFICALLTGVVAAFTM